MSTLTEPSAPDGVERLAPVDPAPRRLLRHAVVIGLAVEVGLRGGLANAAVALAVVLTVRLLWTDRRLARREARILALLAVVPALFLAVRASPWLAWSNALASVALLVVATVHARHGSIVDSTPAALLRRCVSGLDQGVQRLAIVRAVAPDVSRGQREGALRVARGLLVAVPVLLVLVALLAAADAVFASLLTPEIDAGPAAGHVVLTVLFAALVVVLAGAASAAEPEPTRRGRFGVIELTTILGLVGAVLALFVVSQVVALTGAGDRLIESAGLTPAEYARSGFFQLCWATGLLLVVLAVVRAIADPDALRHRVVVVLGAVVPTLALGLVVVSLRRMALYDAAFGLTMLRLAVVAAAFWMGLVLVMTAVRNLGVGSGRDWLVAGAALAGMVIVVLANVANPEAFVVRHNLDRARAGAELDVEYLATLSDDAVPEIGNRIEAAIGPAERMLLRRALQCDGDAEGVAALNLAARRAADVRAGLCR